MLKRKDKSPLNAVIAKQAQDLMHLNTTSEEFKRGLDNLSKLHVMRETEHSTSVSPDVKATIAANLAGIVLIISHERVNVITSKALGFVTKLRP